MEQKAAIRGDMWDSLNIDIPPFRYKSTVSDLACTGHLLQSYKAVKEKRIKNKLSLKTDSYKKIYAHFHKIKIESYN